MTLGTPLYKAGNFIRFTYINPDAKPGAKEIFKEVFILHPNWNGKVHAIDVKKLTVAERTVLEAVMDPDQKGKTHRIPLVNDVLRRMDPPTLIENPISFYQQFVKQFLNNKDAYRTYYQSRMSGVQVVKASEVKGAVTNPKPLFGKPFGQT